VNARRGRVRFPHAATNLCIDGSGRSNPLDYVKTRTRQASCAIFVRVPLLTLAIRRGAVYVLGGDARDDR
jgi:hypothetical protein